MSSATTTRNGSSIISALMEESQVVGRDFKRLRRHRSAAPATAVPNFIGCDGEGGNVNGESAYFLLRIGTALLYPGGGSRIRTRDAFDFMWRCAQDMTGRFVGFFFDYDISNILRDVPWEKLRQLADRESRTVIVKGKNGPREVVKSVTLAIDGEHYWRFDHVPRKTFTLEKIGPGHKRIGKAFHLDDVFGFFACAFLKALKQWNIGEEHWDLIERNKTGRVNMTGIYSDEEIEYNRLECELLSQLMTALAEECRNVGIRPSYWTGAGAIAQALLKKHRAPHDVPFPPEVRDAAQHAFHAGRFECSMTGQIDVPVHEYDLASAYPWAILHLPCLGRNGKHGNWEPHGQWVYRDDLPESGYYVAHIRWTFNNKWRAYSKDNRSLFGPFPVRRDGGSIFYPRNGQGWYWSPEIRSALAISTGQRAVTHPYDFDVLGCWEWQQTCNCTDSFDWVREIYEERKRIGKGGKGIVLKLGLNSLYGKFAQSVGKAPYGNVVYAGLITSMVRARMLDVIATGAQVVMIATDGIYTLNTVDLPGIVEDDGSASLGAWEHVCLSDLFIAKPGHYWSSDKKVKTRGISFRSFEPFIDGYRRATNDDSVVCECGTPEWRHVHVERYAEAFARDGWHASVTVSYRSFVGYRLALQRTDKRVFCQWIEDKTDSSSRTTIYGDAPKRRWYQSRFGGAFVTEPLTGDPDTMSVKYRKMIGTDPFEVSALFEGPDYGRGFGDTEFVPLLDSLDRGDQYNR